MFDEPEIIEFINRIINFQDISVEEIKENIKKFYEYLVLTKMCEDCVLEKILKIIDCLDEILALKNKLGYIDIGSLLIEPETPKKKIKKPVDKKHYGHYESSEHSSSCGTSRTYTSRC